MFPLRVPTLLQGQLMECSITLRTKEQKSGCDNQIL